MSIGQGGFDRAAVRRVYCGDGRAVVWCIYRNWVGGRRAIWYHQWKFLSLETIHNFLFSPERIRSSRRV